MFSQEFCDGATGTQFRLFAAIQPNRIQLESRSVAPESDCGDYICLRIRHGIDFCAIVLNFADATRISVLRTLIEHAFGNSRPDNSEDRPRDRFGRDELQGCPAG